MRILDIFGSLKAKSLKRKLKSEHEKLRQAFDYLSDSEYEGLCERVAEASKLMMETGVPIQKIRGKTTMK